MDNNKTHLYIFGLLLLGAVAWLLFSKHVNPSTSAALSDAGEAIDAQTPPQYSTQPFSSSPVNLTYNFGSVPSNEVPVPSIMPIQISDSGRLEDNSGSGKSGGCSGNCDSCSRYSGNKIVTARQFIAGVSSKSVDQQTENLQSYNSGDYVGNTRTMVIPEGTVSAPTSSRG